MAKQKKDEVELTDIPQPDIEGLEAAKLIGGVALEVAQHAYDKAVAALKLNK